jgi:hypothetical protein
MVGVGVQFEYKILTRATYSVKIARFLDDEEDTIIISRSKGGNLRDAKSTSQPIIILKLVALFIMILACTIPLHGSDDCSTLSIVVL